MSKKELYLVLKKEWFLEILSGEKKEELRDFTDFYINKLCEFDKDDNWTDVKKFDTVKFQLGYKKNAPQIIVECKEIGLNVLESLGEDEELTPANCQFSIILGDILQKINCDNL